jgi:undecaprenyl-diphosphatase
VFRRLNAIEVGLVQRVASLGRRRWAWWPMWIATRGADGWALVVIVPAVVLGWGGRGLAAVGCGAISGVLTAGLIHGVKHSLKRTRPAGVEHSRPITAPDRHAFPSGHTAHAFSTLVLAIWLDPVLGLAFAPFALAVGLSRVFFGLHYPSDVAAGAVSGVAVALLVLRLSEASGLVQLVSRYGPMP